MAFLQEAGRRLLHGTSVKVFFQVSLSLVNDWLDLYVGILKETLTFELHWDFIDIDIALTLKGPPFDFACVFNSNTNHQHPSCIQTLIYISVLVTLLGMCTSLMRKLILKPITNTLIVHSVNFCSMAVIWSSLWALVLWSQWSWWEMRLCRFGGKYLARLILVWPEKMQLTVSGPSLVQMAQRMQGMGQTHWRLLHGY